MLTGNQLGARFVLEQLSPDGICSVGAIGHPSFVKESHVIKSKGTVFSMIDRKLYQSRYAKYEAGPILFSVPSTDSLFSPESRARVVEICTEKKQRFNMQIFSDVAHGFAVSSFQAQRAVYTKLTIMKARARLTDPYELWAKEQHFRIAVEWLDFWLSQPAQP